MEAARARVRQLTESTPFGRFIIGLILLNAVVLGLETYPRVMDSFGDVLMTANVVIVTIFVIEIVLRIFAHGWSFFKDGWSIFDFFVVLVAVIPAGGGSEVLRILRLLRVLRLLSAVKSMRMVVAALGAAIPGIISIGGLLTMIIYMFAVSSTTLFRDTRPDAFGDLWTSTNSLFRIMISDGWPDLVVPMLQERGWIGAYFIVFNIVTTFIALNLFVAVTVEAMNRRHDEPHIASVHGSGAGERIPDIESEVLTEVRALRAQLSELERRLPPDRA